MSSPDVIIIPFLLTKVTDKIVNNSKAKDRESRGTVDILRAAGQLSHFMDEESKVQKG